MDSTVILVTMTRTMLDYQQTIDSLMTRIAALEARVAELTPKDELESDAVH